MSSRNSQDRPRRRSRSSSDSDQGRKPARTRRTDKPASSRSNDSQGPDKRRPRTTGIKPKFESSTGPRPRKQQRRSFQSRPNSSADSSENPRRDAGEPRTYKGGKKEREPFKSKGSKFSSSGLRRERPYKRSDESGRPLSEGKDSKPDKKPFKKVNRSKRSSGIRVQTQPDLKAPAQTEKIRLNRFIANSGVCSRREADELIKMGLISVNGKVITEMGFKVNPGDEVRHESKVLRAERPVYILLNKPKGFLTTTSDPQERNTVMHLIGNTVKERVYPVGRLDRNTTGLLLLTNDGELADKLMHPSYNVKKIYKVELDRPLTKADAQLILDGVQLDEGKAMVDDLAIISDDKRTVGLEIHIGWNRVVRRIFESLNYEVLKLDRSVYAGLDKKNLGRGEWRFLTKEELVRLKHYQR
jgi:23S rRNA pseudouridine2605 synthase